MDKIVDLIEYYHAYTTLCAIKIIITNLTEY